MGATLEFPIKKRWGDILLFILKSIHRDIFIRLTNLRLFKASIGKADCSLLTFILVHGVIMQVTFEG